MEFLKPVSVKKPATLLLTTLCITLFLNSVKAQQTAIKENPDEIKIKYIDGNNDALHFNLKYVNEDGHDFKLMVVNETGDILFQDNYSGKKFKKKLKLPRLTDASNITFLIKPVKKNIQLRYKIKVGDKVEDS
jgi:hypothetical protein